MAVSPRRGTTFGLSGIGGGVRAEAGTMDRPRFSGPIPEVLNGVVFGEVNVPGSVIAGRSLEISGVVGFDCPACIIGRQIRVVANVTGQEERIENVGTLSGRGETAPFSFSFPVPNDPGGAMTVRLKGQQLFPLDPTGWHTDNTAGPFDVRVVSQTAKTVENISEVAPFAIGGSALGAGGAHLANRSLVGGGVAGAGAGVGAKLLLDQFGGFDPDFPTVPVVAVAALLGAGALAVAQVRGAIPG